MGLSEIRDKLIEKFPVLEQVSPENLQSQLEALEPREQKIVISAIIVLAVVIVFSIVKGGAGKIHRLEQEIQTTQSSLKRVQQMTQEAAANRNKGGSLESRMRPSRGFYLASFIQNLASRYGGIEMGTLGRETRQTLGEGIEEVSMDVKISKITYPQMLNFLSDIERSRESLLRLKRLRIKTVPTSQAHVEVNFKVSAYLKK